MAISVGSVPNPLDFVERHNSPGVKDTLVIASGANLPPSGTPLVLTLTFDCHSAEPMQAVVRAVSAAALAAAYAFTGKFEFYQGATIIRTVTVPSFSTSTVVLDYLQKAEVPAEGISKVVFTATYGSGTQPATAVPVELSLRPAS